MAKDSTTHSTPAASLLPGKSSRGTAAGADSRGVANAMAKAALGLPAGRKRGGSTFGPLMSGGRGQFMQAPKTGRWALVGQGPLADAVAAVWPFDGIKLVQWPTYDKDAPLVDGIIEAMPGVSAALDVSLLALARGIPVVTANALLLATHGPVLTAAAQQTGGVTLNLGMEGAVLGTLPVQGALRAAHTVTACFGGAADRMLQRMRYRGEQVTAAENAVRQGGVPLDDLGGKQTLVKMLVMHALWTGTWMNPAQQQRRTLDPVLPEDFVQLQGYGLTLRYGAVMRRGELYVGPLAVADNALAVEGVSLLLEGAAGTQQLVTGGTDMARAVQGILHDVEALLHGRGGALMLRRNAGTAWQRGGNLYYVREQGPGAGGQVLKLGQAPENAALAVPLAGPLPVQLSLPLEGVGTRSGLRRVA